MSEMKHTDLPWRVVSEPHFDNGNVYTSIQPVNVDEGAMKPLAMMNGEFHVCRMSHTAAFWRFNYHRDNAAFIVEACNSYYQMRDALAAKDAEIASATAAAYDLLSIAQRWAALDGGAWNVTRHAREKEELMRDTREAIAKAEGFPQ